MYDSCDVLPIYIFDKILQTQDYTLLNVDNPAEVWKDIVVEYEEKMGEYEQRMKYRKQLEILYLETKLNTLKRCYLVLQTNPPYDIIKEIDNVEKKFGVKNIERGIKSTEALIEIKRKEIEVKGDRKSLDYHIARVSKFLGYRVDKFETTVSEWVELLNMIEEQQKEMAKVMK